MDSFSRVLNGTCLEQTDFFEKNLSTNQQLQRQVIDEKCSKHNEKTMKNNEDATDICHLQDQICFSAQVLKKCKEKPDMSPT